MKDQRWNEIPKKKLILPSIDDLDFEEKISQTIRYSIDHGALYPDAFTASEIGYIKRHHILLPFLQDIERKEYTGEKMDIGEREKILETLTKKLY